MQWPYQPPENQRSWADIRDEDDDEEEQEERGAEIVYGSAEEGIADDETAPVQEEVEDSKPLVMRSEVVDLLEECVDIDIDTWTAEIESLDSSDDELFKEDSREMVILLKDVFYISQFSHEYY